MYETIYYDVVEYDVLHCLKKRKCVYFERTFMFFTLFKNNKTTFNAVRQKNGT